jgi:hypothetical protein
MTRLTAKKNWRTPAVVITCGGLAMTIVLGVGHGFGLYLQPMTLDLGISRETFSFAIALQNLFNLMWWITIAAGLIAAVLTLPVDERQIPRTAANPA